MKIAEISPQHLGADATDADVARFVRACELVIDRYHAILNYDECGRLVEDEVVDFVWGDGDYLPRIEALERGEVLQ